MLLFFFMSFMEIVSGADWCYQSEVSCNHTCSGPDDWGLVSHHCISKAQSPVNIVTRRTLPDGRLTPLHLIGYQDTFHGHLSNNGHTVQLDLPPSIRINGGNLVRTYNAVQLHFHWGKNGGPGSEHTLDGERFPMEMHVVHIKEQYTSISQAVRDRTGVAVLGFFFQESGSANKKFAPLINALKRITRPSNKTTLEGVSLQMFIAPLSNMTAYFRYDGSLTTPLCAEAVVWTLFENPIPLSRQQLAAFSQLEFFSGRPMVNTFRPVQPLNGRQVYRSGSHVAGVSAALLLVSLLVHTP
ncbi:carbonic anhydrase 4b [Entelurus aequoreus]|uniref:carbonic anhydrase 4b n=1 Tax=Entelurus aequoreus TaxID=161455 RepID=UPI002B1D6589|nr:carbonic anhydrase 4b [Entelurus aequoreus]